MLVWYSFGTACLVALSIGSALALVGNNLDWKEVLSSIGLNLIASVVFALLFATLATWVQDRNIEETIEESLAGFSVQVQNSITRTNRIFLPVTSYSPVNPANSFGDGYNSDVTDSMEQSDFFAFYGPSARYVAARLQKARHHPQQIRIAMINPANRRAISRRAIDRTAWPKFKDQDVEEIERELEDELLMNIVSLFDCRRRCPVEILYNDDTAVYRYVMFDQSVYVSWYHSPESTEMEMPESYKFARDSFIYSTLRMDLTRRFEMSPHKVVFDASQTDDFLIEHLGTLTSRPVTPEQIRRWRGEHQEDTVGFARYLDELYRSHGQPDR